MRDNRSLVVAMNDSVRIMKTSLDNNHSLMDRKRYMGQTQLLKAANWNQFLPNVNIRSVELFDRLKITNINIIY